MPPLHHQSMNVQIGSKAADESFRNHSDPEPRSRRRAEAGRGYRSNQHRGEYVLKLRGPYDSALNRHPDGTFGLITDWWDGPVEREVGTNYGRLLQLYGLHKARIEAQKKGYTVRRQALVDGSIKLVIGGV